MFGFVFVELVIEVLRNKYSSFISLYIFFFLFFFAKFSLSFYQL